MGIKLGRTRNESVLEKGETAQAKGSKSASKHFLFPHGAVKRRNKQEMDVPDDTKGDLDEGVDQGLKLALDTASGKLSLTTAGRRENKRPEVDAVNKLPIVDSLVRVLEIV